ncbi:MAG: PilZ domain-containing protein [Hyphomicrobiales bacterium]
MERRQQKRFPVRFLGQLIETSGGNSCIVTITEISEKGARVDLPDRAEMSGTVTLFNTVDGTSKRCRIAWRKGDQMGLAFEEA